MILIKTSQTRTQQTRRNRIKETEFKRSITYIRYLYDSTIEAYYKKIARQTIYVYSRKIPVEYLPKGYSGLTSVPYNDKAAGFKEDISPPSDDPSTTILEL